MKKSLRPSQAADFLGISRVTVYRWIRERPDFPRPIHLSSRCTVFDQDELSAWRDAHSTGRKAA